MRAAAAAKASAAGIGRDGRYRSEETTGKGEAGEASRRLHAAAEATDGRVEERGGGSKGGNFRVCVSRAVRPIRGPWAKVFFFFRAAKRTLRGGGRGAGEEDLGTWRRAEATAPSRPVVATRLTTRGGTGTNKERESARSK